MLENVLEDVVRGIRNVGSNCQICRSGKEQIVVDIGLGFGKTFEQNLELLAKLDKIVNEFKEYPVLVGASRKSFIGKILGDVPPGERISGSLAAAVIAIVRGAKIVRVHDVKETANAIKVASR